VFKVLLYWHHGLGQARLLVPRIHGKIEDVDASISQSVGDFGPEKASVRANINPKALFGCVIHHFVRKLRSQQRLASHESDHSATMIVEPVDRAPGNVLGHAFHFVAVRPAVPAIEIALVLQEQIRSYGMEISG